MLPSFLLLLLLLLSTATPSSSSPSACTPPPSLALGRLQLRPPPLPGNATAYASWLSSMQSFRTACLAEVMPSGAAFEVPALAWTRTAYMQPLMMPFDRMFYDDASGKWTVDRWLADLQRRYGGIDSALIWPTYTNIGVDDRDQFDLIEAMPGGAAGLKAVVGDMHAAGVHVLYPYNPWDQGTRGGSPNNPTAAAAADASRLAALLSATGADGFFGDTISSAGLQRFFDDSVKDGRPAAIQPEAGGTPPSLNYTTMGWGYWSTERAPPVDLMKWLEPRWLTQVCERWSQDKTDMIQLAFFNGDGVETWQNVWGIWNGLTDFDAEALRRVGAMLRFFGRRRFLQSKGWLPHSPAVLQQDQVETDEGSSGSVFGSEWPLGNETLWTLVNRGGQDAKGAQLAVPSRDRRSFWNCYSGEQLVPAAARHDDSDSATAAARLVLTFDVEVRGYGCVLATPNATLDKDTAAFLATMRAMTAARLDSFSRRWMPLQQQMVNQTAAAVSMAAAVAATSRPRPAAAAVPLLTDAIEIPATTAFRFAVRGMEIEGIGVAGFKGGVDVQFPWEPFAVPVHDHVMSIPRFHIDRVPVTRGNYSAYLQDTEYRPLDTHNWLKDWNWKGSLVTTAASNTSAHVYGQNNTKGARTRGGALTAVPRVRPGDEDRPVVYVSMREARMYCAHRGMRLPHSWEWQYAAQGTDGRR